MKRCAAHCRALPSGAGVFGSRGQAAWQMAHAAVELLGRPDGGVVITKYGHVKGEIPGVTCYEAAHPVPTKQALPLPKRRWRWCMG